MGVDDAQAKTLRQKANTRENLQELYENAKFFAVLEDIVENICTSTEENDSPTDEL